MRTLTLSTHAAHRSRERLNLPSHAAMKLAVAALAQGLTVEDVAGSLRRYLHDKKANHDRPVFFRIHAEQVFVFGTRNDATTFITVWHLPSEFKSTVTRILRQRNNRN